MVLKIASNIEKYLKLQMMRAPNIKATREERRRVYARKWHHYARIVIKERERLSESMKSLCKIWLNRSHLIGGSRNVIICCADEQWEEKKKEGCIQQNLCALHISEKASWHIPPLMGEAWSVLPSDEEEKEESPNLKMVHFRQYQRGRGCSMKNGGNDMSGICLLQGKMS